MSDQARQIGGKTRSLRKYEGDPEAFAAVGGTPALDLLSPFGPAIGRTAVPQPVTDRLNLYADTLARPGEFLVPPEVMIEGGEGSLHHLIDRAVRRYAEVLEGQPPAQVEIDVAWIVCQGADTPSPAHFHSCDVSGILYLGLPQGIGDEGQTARTYISGRKAGWINFIHGDRQRFSRSLVSFRPAIGVLYVFPGWLLHVAEPFLGPGERRSLSFNAVVT